MCMYTYNSFIRLLTYLAMKKEGKKLYNKYKARWRNE